MKNLKKLLAVVVCIAMMVPTLAFAASSPAKVDVSGAKVSAGALTYTGSAQTPKLTVVIDGKTLVEGTDFTVAGSTKVTNAGSYKVTITGIGSFTGEKTIAYTVAPKKVSATATATNKVATGKAQRINPVVKADGLTLKYGTDYTVTGNVHTAAGKYAMVITGKGNYSFKKTVYYRIQNAMSTVSASALTKTYTGKAQTTKVTVKYGGKVLTRGVDYSITGVVRATNAGKYTVKVTGINNYTGTKTITYTINKASQSKVKIVTSGVRKRVGVTGVQGGAKVTYTTNNTKVKVTNGNVAIAKGVKKGTKVKITVKVGATKNFNAYTKTITYTVK